MSAARNILAMITTVDPTDTARLDEIDAHVLAYRDRLPAADVVCIDGRWGLRAHGVGVIEPRRYTRSRSALKAIRPNGYVVQIEHHRFTDGTDLGYEAAIEGNTHCFGTFPDYGPFQTEELAELHAIIQAIEHERSLKGAAP
jgi:hypothetical protein